MEVSVLVTNAFSPDARKIFKPDSIDETLRGWLLHAHKGRLRHDFSARRYESYRLSLGIAAALLSTFAGASVLSNLVEQSSVVWLKWLIGGIGILAGLCASLITFLKLSEQVEKHRSAGVGYKVSIRELERMISLGSSALAPTDVENVQKQLDELEENAPVVSERIYAHVEKEWNKHGIKYVDKAAGLYPPK